MQNRHATNNIWQLQLGLASQIRMVMNYEVNIRAENIAFGKNSDKLNNHELEKGISLANMEEKKELNYYN